MRIENNFIAILMFNASLSFVLYPIFSLWLLLSIAHRCQHRKTWQPINWLSFAMRFFFLCCLGHQPSVMCSWRKWHVATASAAGLCLCVCGCNELLMANHKIMARSLRHRYKYTNNQHIDDAVKRKATEMGLNATSGCVATFDLLTISLARRGAGLR